ADDQKHAALLGLRQIRRSLRVLVDAGDLPLRPTHRGFGLAAGTEPQQAGGSEDGGTRPGRSSAPVSSAQVSEVHQRSSPPADATSARSSARTLSAQWSNANSETVSHIFLILAPR